MKKKNQWKIITSNGLLWMNMNERQRERRRDKTFGRGAANAWRHQRSDMDIVKSTGCWECSLSSLKSKASLGGKKSSIQEKLQEEDGGNGSGHGFTSQLSALPQLCSHKHPICLSHIPKSYTQYIDFKYSHVKTNWSQD